MGKLPYGFTVAENGVHLVPCLPEQRVLHRIARLRGQGDSLRKIAETLNQERRFNRYGRPWNNVLLHTVCKDLAQRLTA